MFNQNVEKILSGIFNIKLKLSNKKNNISPKEKSKNIHNYPNYNFSDFIFEIYFLIQSYKKKREVTPLLNALRSYCFLVL